MPNWCSNRVTVYSRGENVTKDIQKIKEIFESKDTVFGKIIPQPDWKNTPNENGELPKLHTEYAKDGSVLFSYYQFPDGSNDSRWYDWNLANWDTKWDVAGNVEIILMVLCYFLARWRCLIMLKVCLEFGALNF